MTRAALVTKKVEEIYTLKSHSSNEWVTWGYKNHVMVVKRNAEELAKEKGANVEFCICAAVLHSIADTIVLRNNPKYEQKNIEMASIILNEFGFSSDEIYEIIYNIIIPHSSTTSRPITLEAKIVSTADALAHFQTDYYTYFCWRIWSTEGNIQDYEGFKVWVLEKLEKDFNKKIFFDDIKEEVRGNYESLKTTFENNKAPIR